MNSKMHRYSFGAIVLVGMLALSACAGEPAPIATPTAEPAVESMIPQYDQEATSAPPFTISGRGERITRIVFPSATEGDRKSVV